MKSSQLITFENSILGTIRGFVDKDGEPWFLAGQVCRCLGIKDSTSAVKQAEERMKIAENYYSKVGQVSNRVYSKTVLLDNTNFGDTKVRVIKEQLLYELIFASRKQAAIAFRAWATGDVLPSLRKWGEYRMKGKLIRRSLTDTIKEEIVEKSDSENERRFAYSNFSRLVNRSLGLPYHIDRGSLPAETLERIAKRENLVQAMVAEGRKYGEIKSFIENFTE